MRKAWERDGGTHASYQELDAHATMDNLLATVLSEIIDGDFGGIRQLLREPFCLSSPLPASRADTCTCVARSRSGANGALGEETIASFELACMRLRELVLQGERSTRILRGDIILAWEIGQRLRALRWFDIRGRLGLTLQMTRVLISL